MISISSNILFYLICSPFLWGSNYMYVRLAAPHIFGSLPPHTLSLTNLFSLCSSDWLLFGYYWLLDWLLLDWLDWLLFLSSLTLLHLQSAVKAVHLIIVSISLYCLFIHYEHCCFKSLSANPNIWVNAKSFSFD